MPIRRFGRVLTIALSLALFITLSSTGYTVKRGDTLAWIAREHDVSTLQLARLNQLDDPDLIFPGQVLEIPGANDTATAFHVVASGETLARIAEEYGTSAAALAQLNELVNPDLIRPGQSLSIPTSGETPARVTEPEPTGAIPEGRYVRSGRSHIVKTGESVEKIASDHGVTVDAVVDANGIVDRVIYNGTRLFLDGAPVIAGGGGGTIRHLVVTGDRLGDLAARYETSITAIVRANNLADPNLIRRGQSLTIPAADTWKCPLEDASFFNDWGFPRSGGRYHEGNDMFSDRRAPVRAPVAGRLVFKTGSIGGYQFNLYGDDGIEYLGSHMDGFAGSSRRVAAGEIVGYVGTSGNAAGTRPHTHFGMYLNEVAVNPYPTLIQNGCK